MVWVYWTILLTRGMQQHCTRWWLGMPRLQDPWNTRSHENTYTRIGSRQHTIDIIKIVQDLSHSEEGYYNVESGGVLRGHHGGGMGLWGVMHPRVWTDGISLQPQMCEPKSNDEWHLLNQQKVLIAVRTRRKKIFVRQKQMLYYFCSKVFR